MSIRFHPTFQTYFRSIDNTPAFVEEDALEIHLERLRIGGLGQRFLLRNLAVLDQLEQRLVEISMPSSAAGLDGRGQVCPAGFPRSIF